MNTKQAISELKTLLSQKRAGEHAEALLERLAFVEQETKEAEGKKLSLAGDIKSLLGEKESLAGIVAKAKSDADLIIAKADQDAEKIRLDAKSDGGRIIAKAKEESDKLESTLSGLRDSVESLRFAETKAKADLAAIEKALSDARAKAVAVAGI